MLRVRVLGELTVERDCEPVALPPGRRSRALLGWLAVRRGARPRSEVAGRLWPDVLDESARTSLRSALAELRRVVGADLIAASRDTVGLAEGVSVDLHKFDELARAGDAEEALGLVRGELLGGLSEEWVYEERERQSERERELLARLAARAEKRGDTEAAIAYARRRLESDPLSEEAGRALIRLLAAAGERATALAAYSRLAERLRRELGTGPAAETRMLAEKVRRETREGALPPVPPLPVALSARHRSPFTGRAGPLAMLRRAWDAARRGERRLLLVAGDAGIGKTRLVSELARGAHTWGATVLYGRSQPGAITPYGPFAEALRPFIAACAPGEARALVGPLAGELSRLVPDQADRLPPVDATPATDPEGARYRLFEACSSLLAGAARIRPLLLVVEDLHWADPSSIALFRHLVVGGPAPLLLLGTYRQSDLGEHHPLAEALGALRREPGFEGVALGGLSADDIGAVAAAWLGSEAAGEIAQALADSTGGNPFFVEELVRQLADRRHGGDRRAQPTPADLAVPQGVLEVIAERLALLGEHARETLLLAAVIGHELDLDLLAEATGAGREPLVSDLERAVAAHLLREEQGRPGRYAFPHALVREAVYAQLSSARRMLLHEQVASALERRWAGALEVRAGELAHHYLLAGEGPDQRRKAVAYAQRAGHGANRALAYAEAARYYELALKALAGADPTARRRAELGCALGEARLRAGGKQAAMDAFDDAAAAAREANAPQLLARAALGRSGLGIVVLAPDHATVDVLEEALQALGTEPDLSDRQALRARLLARLAVELYHVSEHRREELSAEALTVAPSRDDARARADALNARHVALWSPNHLQARTAIAEELVALGESAGEPEWVLQGRNWRVLDLLEQGTIEQARAEIDAHARLADELQLPSFQWWAPSWRAMLAILEGHLDEAERLRDEATEIGRRTHDPTADLFAFIQTVAIRAEREPPTGPLPDHVPERMSVGAVTSAYRATLPAIYAESGRVADARAELAVLARDNFSALTSDMNRLSSIALLARGADALGDTRRAAELYELLLPYRSRAILVGRAALCHGPAELYLGLLASVRRRPEAEDHLAEALRWAHDTGAHLIATWARTYLAELFLRRGAEGDTERAADEASAAAALARTSGLGRIASRADRLLAAAGGAADTRGEPPGPSSVPPGQ